MTNLHIIELESGCRRSLDGECLIERSGLTRYGIAVGEEDVTVQTATVGLRGSEEIYVVGMHVDAHVYDGTAVIGYHIGRAGVAARIYAVPIHLIAHTIEARIEVVGEVECWRRHLRLAADVIAGTVIVLKV